MFPSVEILDDGVNIPVHETNDYCFIEWNEEETSEEALKRAQKNNLIQIYSHIIVWPNDLKEEDLTYEDLEIYSYKITCGKTLKSYFLISTYEIEEFDDIKHCICVPYNGLNIFKIIKELFGSLPLNIRYN